jgi:spore maturation protein CgeB
MKFVIFGLTISSSWGNGHATLWRALCKALTGRGHHVTFFERDVPYYASHRDLLEIPGGQLVMYSDWQDVLGQARRQLADADVAMITSFCPDGVAAARLVFESPARQRVFYDLDTPVTLQRWKAGESLAWIGPDGLREFDLVLSFTGGQSLHDLQRFLGARRVAPLYGSVDPDVHRPVPPVDAFRADLSYLGTYAEDRQQALETLFIESARQSPARRFLIAGAQYPPDFPWSGNIFFVRHLPPPDHPAFYCSARITLNVTRRVMAESGYCPSGRLFEAAACGTPILTDWWEGLNEFFEPGREIIVARNTADAVSALELSDAELTALARAARERTLTEHSADARVDDLEAALESSERLRDRPFQESRPVHA